MDLMDELTTAGILLNAVQAPYEIFEKLREKYDPEEIFKGESFWDELGLNKNLQRKLSNLIEKGWAEEEFKRVEKFDSRFITANDLDYPAKLKDLKNPPIGLYVKGNLNISLPSIAIVGTRKCSEYARTTAMNLAKAVSRSGITVISGGARGIDTAAHRGALSEDGRTIAVFGTGLDKVYPSENKTLFSRILDRGALISEYPMGTGGLAWHFPQRNRIIVGIASRVVVAESPDGGGAMLTAHEALEIGRELWSIPGRITDDVSKGTNMLLNEGAESLFAIEEFIKSIGGNRGQLEINFGEIPPEKTQPNLTDNEKIIYSLLQRQGGRTSDEILIESGLDFADVQEALMSLEAEGLIMSSSGRYSVTA